MSDPDDQAVNDAIDLLRRNGYQVLLPQGRPRWESPAHFCERMGIDESSLQRTLRRALAAGMVFDAQYHSSLRMRVILSNHDLEAFIQRNRARGGKSKSRPVPASV